MAACYIRDLPCPVGKIANVSLPSNKSDFQAMVCCSVGFLMPAKCLLRPCWIIFANFFSMSSSHCFLAFAIIQPNAFSHLVRSICGYNAEKIWTGISGLIYRPHFYSGLIPVKITTAGFENRLFIYVAATPYGSHFEKSQTVAEERLFHESLSVFVNFP